MMFSVKLIVTREMYEWAKKELAQKWRKGSVRRTYGLCSPEWARLAIFKSAWEESAHECDADSVLLKVEIGRDENGALVRIAHFGDFDATYNFLCEKVTTRLVAVRKDGAVPSKSR